MDKRTLLAIILTFLILSLYSFVLTKFYPIENKKDIAKTPLKSEFAPQKQNAFSIPSELSPPGKTSEETIIIGKHEIVFSLPEGAIKSVYFKGYDHRLSLGKAFLYQDKPYLPFIMEKTAEAVIFSYTGQAEEIIKRFNFSNSNYSIEIELINRNLSDSVQKSAPQLLLAKIFPSKRNLEDRFLEADLFTSKEILRTGIISPKKEMGEVMGLKAVGFRDRYFCAILRPLNSLENKAFVRKITNEGVEIGISLGEKEILPHQERRERFLLYLGPQDNKELTSLGKEYKEIIYFGTFDPISKVLLGLLSFFQQLTHNWGLAVIILSIFTFIVLYPLTFKQMSSMKQMQALQPQIEQLRITYKDNPQRLNKEIMELYRKHKINPLGGCLPLILQIPIFFSLYQGLMRSTNLKGAAFLWIKDLSQPDRLFTLSSSLPVIGNEVNILPILMAGMMFVQQRLSMKTATQANLEQQRIMAVLMPLLFGFIFYHLPGGLVLYWSIHSLLTLIYQWKVSR